MHGLLADTQEECDLLPGQAQRPGIADLQRLEPLSELTQRARRTQPGRRILIHVNNTNPILREDSAERQALTAAGVEVAADGLELTL